MEAKGGGGERAAKSAARYNLYMTSGPFITQLS